MPSAQGKSYVIYFKKVSPISVSVDDVVAICDDQVTLSAVVTGNLTHRTFWWELVSGPAILWITSQDQTTVTWAPADIVRTDRLFKFYINKDDPFNEEIYEVWVFATPTDQFDIPQQIINDGGIGKVVLTENIYYTGDEPRATEMYTENPLGFTPRLYFVEQESISTNPQAPKESSISQSTNFYVVWNYPLIYRTKAGMTRQIKEFILENTLDGINWNTVGTYSQPQAVAATPGYSYRVKAVYSESFTFGGQLNQVMLSSTHTWNEVVSPVIFPTPISSVIGSERAFAVDNFKISTSVTDLTITDYTVIVRNLMTYDWTTFTELDNDQVEPAINYVPVISLYDVIVRNLLIYDWTTFTELDNDQHSVGGQDIKYYDKYSIITNYVVAGGGTIGG